MKKVVLMILCTFPLWVNAQVNDFRKVVGMKSNYSFSLRSAATEIQVLDSIVFYDVICNPYDISQCQVVKGKTELEYDSKGNEISRVFYVWDDYYTNTWVKDSKLGYQYDGNNNLISSIIHVWDGDAWVAVVKIEYEYEGKSSPASYLSYLSIGDDDWMKLGKAEFQYDDKDSPIAVIGYSLDGETWIKVEQLTYQYDDNGNPISVTSYLWDAYFGDWEEIRKMEFEIQYDDNNNIVSMIGHYSDKYGEFTNLTYEYYYSTLSINGISSNYSTLSDITVYPNPAKDYIVVKGAAGSTVTISGLSDGIVYKQNMSGEREIINVSSWASGVYLITVETGNRKVTSKIIKK